MKERISPVEITYLIQRDRLDLRLFFILVLTDLINRKILNLISEPNEKILIEKGHNSVNYSPKLYENRFLRMFTNNRLGHYSFKEYLEFVLIDTFDNDDWLKDIKHSSNLRVENTIRDLIKEDFERKELQFRTKYFHIYKLSESSLNLPKSESELKNHFNIFSYTDNTIDVNLIDLFLEETNDYVSVRKKINSRGNWKNYNVNPGIS